MQIVTSSTIDILHHIEWTQKDPLIKNERKDIIVISGDRGGIEYRSFSNLLDFYFHRNHISREQFRAGFKFYRLWHFTILRDRYVKCNYGSEIRGEIDFEDLAIIPHQFIEAKMAITNPNARIAVIDVCCLSISPGRRKMHLVQEGLDNLILYFKQDKKRQHPIHEKWILPMAEKTYLDRNENNC